MHVLLQAPVSLTYTFSLVDRLPTYIPTYTHAYPPPTSHPPAHSLNPSPSLSSRPQQLLNCALFQTPVEFTRPYLISLGMMHLPFISFYYFFSNTCSSLLGLLLPTGLAAFLYSATYGPLLLSVSLSIPTPRGAQLQA